MTDFGDVRSAVQAQDEVALKDALRNYEDNVPVEGVISYIREIWGWCPASRWRGRKGDGNGRTAIDAHKPGHPTLSAWVDVGAHQFRLLQLNDAETHIQGILLPTRLNLLDQYWKPWAAEAGVCAALPYDAVRQPELRPEARDYLWAALGHYAWDATIGALSDTAEGVIEGVAKVGVLLYEGEECWDVVHARFRSRQASALDHALLGRV